MGSATPALRAQSTRGCQGLTPSASGPLQRPSSLHGPGNTHLEEPGPWVRAGGGQSWPPLGPWGCVSVSLIGGELTGAGEQAGRTPLPCSEGLALGWHSGWAVSEPGDPGAGKKQGRGHSDPISNTPAQLGNQRKLTVPSAGWVLGWCHTSCVCGGGVHVMCVRACGRGGVYACTWGMCTRCVCACGVWQYTYVHVCAGGICVHAGCARVHTCVCVAGDSLCSQGVFTGTSLRLLHKENGTTYSCLKKKPPKVTSVPHYPVTLWPVTSPACRPRAGEGRVSGGVASCLIRGLPPPTPPEPQFTPVSIFPGVLLGRGR